MNAIFKKLNYKADQKIFVINGPDAFREAVAEMKEITKVKTSISDAKEVEFLIAFVTKQKEVDDLTKKVAPLLTGDGTFWFAYPKGTSKKYVCEFNRDTGWATLGKLGFEPVRMVAIDSDWSALRFRRIEHIKKMTRSSALSEAGKKRIAARKR